MAGGTRFVSATRWFINLLSASAICVSLFVRRPPIGFAMKFFAFAFLIATWVMFWRSVAHKFRWSGVIRGLIPSVLFLAPMATLHAFDRSFGNQKGRRGHAMSVFLPAIPAMTSASLRTDSSAYCNKQPRLTNRQ